MGFVLYASINTIYSAVGFSCLCILCQSTKRLYIFGTVLRYQEVKGEIIRLDGAEGIKKDLAFTERTFQQILLSQEQKSATKICEKSCQRCKNLHFMHRHFKQYIMKKVTVGRWQQCKRRLSQIFVIQLFLYQMAGDDSALSRLGDWDGYQVSSHLTTEIQETTHRKGQGVCWIQRICFFSISSQAFFLKIGLHGHTSVRMWQKQQNINTPFLPGDSVRSFSTREKTK